ncbi:hypothetical protein D918_00306 [Trichuris suis]|nr:hypothetical protein D918_00306 [Trichuris suis]
MNGIGLMLANAIIQMNMFTLNAGWSVKSDKPLSHCPGSTLTEAEVKHVKDVLARAEKLSDCEKIRVG